MGTSYTAVDVWPLFIGDMNSHLTCRGSAQVRARVAVDVNAVPGQALHVKQARVGRSTVIQ